MGAKTALLAFAEGDLRPTLREAVRSDPTVVLERVRELHPEYEVTPVGDGSLGDYSHPPDDTGYATILPGAELYCDRRLVWDPPSQIPAPLLRAAAGRRIIMHGMHSVSDRLSFAVWENGELVRALSMAPDGGIGENIGEPYDFELPFWAGEHPVEPVFSEDPYPLPFHPLDLGEEVLRAFFGFILEGVPGDVDPFDVPLHGFRIADPTGREQAERESRMEEIWKLMKPPRRYTSAPDGSFREITDGTR
ncbi:hypothetical protein Q0Z83_027960 [Actinoplanes sichuanensis]|uniref:DUF6928 family protein n=1 Tax=Actinoplanes sichuanensis TaxID=512349 RepID=A0ABW4AV88_9ACTN|nr:hypothetical protein [Actinoplanes sichuanensis]BEL04605.1 hypothetical protein Q0Z83_027960 [Actinoplanes sichuanensis]